MLAQVFSWISTFLVARILTPEDYGLFGMASLFFWAIQSLGEFGLGAAVIKQRDLTGEQIAQLNTVSVLFGLAAMSVVAAAAGPMSVFFAAPELSEIMLVSGLTFLVSGFRTIPSAMLQRDLQFRRLAANDTFHAVVLAVLVLAAATAGLEYWSLVLGNLLAAVIGTAALVASRPVRLARPRTETIRGAVRLGREVVAARFGWYAMFNADFLVAGRMLGKAPLGSYTFAWTLASLPVEKISLLVTRVSLPFLAAVQNRRESLRRYVFGMTEGLSLVTFPAAIGIGLVAAEVVHLALGPRWETAIAPLRVLAVVAPMRSVATLLPQMTTVVGRTRFGMYHSLAAAVAMAVAFVVGSRWGTVGIAVAWAVGYPLALIPLLRVVLGAIDASPGQYLATMIPAINGSLIMAVAVTALRSLMPPPWPEPVRLSLLVAGGAAVYALTLWIFHRNRVRAAVAFVRSAGAP